jgi:hypothetical protein
MALGQKDLAELRDIERRLQEQRSRGSDPSKMIEIELQAVRQMIQERLKEARLSSEIR